MLLRPVECSAEDGPRLSARSWRALHTQIENESRQWLHAACAPLRWLSRSVQHRLERLQQAPGPLPHRHRLPQCTARPQYSRPTAFCPTRPLPRRTGARLPQHWQTADSVGLFTGGQSAPIKRQPCSQQLRARAPTPSATRSTRATHTPSQEDLL